MEKTQRQLRVQYLKDLAEEYNIETAIVFELAAVLGPNEDYDGLICALEDYQLYEGFYGE